MNKFFLFLVLSISASAQIVLDSFNLGNATGVVQDGTSWVGQLTQNAETLTVAGTAKDDNGWGAIGIGNEGAGISGSLYDQVTVVAQLDAGNQASFFTVQFLDTSFATKVVSVPMTSFTLGGLSTVNIPIAWSDFDPANIIGWSIGGGVPPTGSLAFRMTLDSISLSSSLAVPEPSTYAMLATGLLVVGFTVRRRMVRS